jgi:hypothetical protein
VGRSLFVAAILALALAPPTGSGQEEPDPPDGMLVLAVAGGAAGSRVVTREWAAVADPRSGALHKRRFPGGTLCHGPLLAVGGHVIFSGSRGRTPVVRAMPLSLRGPARALGAADSFTPAGARLWLGRWHRRGHRSVALRLVDMAGRVRARASDRLSRWSTLDAATSGGLVITHGRRLTLWDPRTQRSLRSVRDAWFLAAGAARVVWCRGGCLALHVWRGHVGRAIAPPAGMRLLGYGGALSPDERQLATGVTVDGRKRLAVVNLRSETWRLVPGGRLGGYDAMEWSPSGRWLYFTDSNSGMRAWRLGARSSAALPIRPGGTVMSIAAAG